MRKYLIFYFFIIISISLIDVSAQNITVTARIDSTTMWIGNQTKLSFEISQQAESKVITPLFSDTIGALEIVEPLKADTVVTPDGHILVTQSYTVTAFEDSLLYIPSFPFIEGEDTVWSKSLSLKVIQPFVIDTATNKFADIKPVFTPKFYWKGLFKTILTVLAIVVILVLLFFLIRKLFNKKSIVEEIKPEKLLPAYQIAFSKLDEIKDKKIWQQNRSKEYHTELTDVIREYIENNFNVSSMEMTSDEILQQLHRLRFDKKSAYLTLEQLLRLADLVKFAKWEPTIDEHEKSLKNAYLFVNETKVEEEQPEDIKEEAVQEAE